MIAAHVSRTDEKGPGAWPAVTDGGGELSRELGVDRVSSVTSVNGVAGIDGRLPESPESEGCGVFDESARTRLMADIMRLIREPTIPQSARLAGLTLIGWLARRRPHETPHAIGVEEARASEQRLRAARAKSR